jgi:hypothetical protein
METMHDIHGLIKIGDYDEGKKIVDSLRISVDGARGPRKNVDEDDDLGETKFNKELKV